MDTIYFARLKPTAIIPSKRDEDACYDIYACFDEDEINIGVGETKLIPTAIVSAFDKKYCIILKERGSTGTIGLSLKAGVIDSGYRGEWFVALNNTSRHPICISKKYSKTTKEGNGITYYPYIKAICQAKLEDVKVVKIQELHLDDLLKFESERGIGALGSSNK